MKNMSHNIQKKNQIKFFSNFNELIETPFEGIINAHCWNRNLIGDFEEIANKLILHEDITIITINDLMNLNLSENGDKAREIIIEDLKLLSELGASPTLNLLKCYDRDDTLDFISTDVYSYHVDSSPISTDTFLCTYFGASSDILPNDSVTQKILIPEIRSKLKELHDGADDEFELFLEEFYFDLHYQANTDAEPINLGLGNLWRLAVKNPQQLVPPCVHRAPRDNKNELRLLLIC